MLIKAILFTILVVNVMLAREISVIMGFEYVDEYIMLLVMSLWWMRLFLWRFLEHWTVKGDGWYE